jgi:predicted PurR-regulated permease PerM
VFWTVLSTVVSLLPLVGASLVWLPASAYLFLIDEPARAALLFAYGALLVSASDNYLRPIIGGHEANLSPGLFVVGIFGGVVAMGFLGLFFGPVILGVLKALVEVYVDEYSPRTE